MNIYMFESDVYQRFLEMLEGHITGFYSIDLTFSTYEIFIIVPFLFLFSYLSKLCYLNRQDKTRHYQYTKKKKPASHK